MSSASEQVLHVRDHHTIVRDSGGSGVPVVLVHALALNCHMWTEGIFERLTKRPTEKGMPRRVIAYDLRGHGRAQDAPVTRSLEQLAEDLRALVGTLDLKKVDLMGVSFGGAVAQTFVLAYPQMVRSAAFIATTSTGNHIMANRATRAETDGVESMIDETISRWFLPAAIAAEDKSVQFARDRLTTTQKENWAAAWRAMASIDCLDELAKIQVPVLVLAGKQDTSTPPAVMKSMYESCKHAEYEEIDRGMHMFVMENTEATSAKLTGFLTRVDAASSV